MTMKRNSDILPNDSVFRYYFYFMQERMNIFWRKCEGKQNNKWTDDAILKEYKFTNVYRATDRVSQYLIHDVIYKDLDRYSPEDVLLRILVFKIFNKPETWDFLNHTLEYPITIKNFAPHRIAQILTKYQVTHPIFNNAYMMAGSHQKYDYLQTKHEKWLTMVKKEFLDAHLLEKILEASSLEKVYNLLKNCSLIGGFLAYQYAIDFNYSPYVNFDENSFVKAGIGAIRGIRKCFSCFGKTFEDAIQFVAENFHELSKRYGYDHFRSLPNHEPTLIDLQNCFCETDKYLRAKMPDLKLGNTRIKQHYKESPIPISYMFPPKWNISTRLEYKPHIEGDLFLNLCN